MYDNCIQIGKNNGENFLKNFLVIALGHFGDTLLVDGLCQNIKKYNPSTKITILCEKNYIDIPKLIKWVDNVISFDAKGEHKGLLGYFNFARQFSSLSSFDVAIITHPHERSVICAKILGAKKIISLPLRGKLNLLNLFINEKREYIENEIRNEYKNNYNSDYLKKLGIDILHFYPSFFIPHEIKENIQKFNLPDKYIVLVSESKDEIKNWDYQNLSLFIKNSSFPIVLTGTENTLKRSKKLREDGINFIDLCGKTTILELALLIKNSIATVSVDTGSMHLAYGLGVETICLFFVPKMVKEWFPKNLSNVHLLLGERYLSGSTIKTKKDIVFGEVLSLIEKVRVVNEKV